MSTHLELKNLNPNHRHIDFIDTAKGICILLVVLFHSNLININTPCLGMLRMPFYFTIYGIFFKNYGGFIPTVLKKVNRLIIPFSFFYIISYLLYVLIRLIIDVEIDIPFFSFITSKVIVNVALWFLLALFWANVMFFILTHFIHDTYKLAFSALLIGIVALYVFNEYNYLPLYIDSGLAALPFFAFGYLLKSTSILYSNRLDKYNIPAIIFLSIISYCLFIIGDKPYIGFGNIYKQGSVLCFYLGSVSTVIAIILLCKTVGTIPGIRYIGRYSIIILGFHVPISNCLKIVMKYISPSLNPIVSDILLFGLTLSICIIIIPILTSYLPKLTAQKDLINVTYKIQKNSDNLIV